MVTYQATNINTKKRPRLKQNGTATLHPSTITEDISKHIETDYGFPFLKNLHILIEEGTDSREHLKAPLR